MLVRSFLRVLPPVLSALVGCADTDANNALTMYELCAVPLPQGFEPSGIAVLDSGKVALWEFSSRQLVVVRRTGDHTMRLLPAGARTIALREHGDGLEVVDALRRALLNSTATAGTAVRSFGGGQETWRAAVNTPSGFVVARTSAGQLRVGHLNRSANGILDYVVVDSVRSNALTGEVSLASASGTVTLASQRAPFFAAAWKHLADTLEVRPLEVPRRVQKQSQRAEWRAGALVPIPGGFLRTFSDVRSNTRVFVRYDETLRLRGELTVNAPIAIAAYLDAGDAVLAVRDVGTPEAVYYGLSNDRRLQSRDSQPYACIHHEAR